MPFSEVQWMVGLGVLGLPETGSGPSMCLSILWRDSVVRFLIERWYSPTVSDPGWVAILSPVGPKRQWDIISTSRTLPFVDLMLGGEGCSMLLGLGRESVCALWCPDTPPFLTSVGREKVPLR